MIIRTIGNFIRSCALFGLIVSLHAAQEKQVKKVPPTSQNQASGAELYKQHCSACHGRDLRGTGPVPSPYREPPDLTGLARRHGGTFPDAYVANILRNGVILPAHGPAEMPVWGTNFRAMDGLDATQVTERIIKLTNYIKSLQAK
jgi:mono/diheme cytochrome c family protein